MAAAGDAPSDLLEFAYAVPTPTPTVPAPGLTLVYADERELLITYSRGAYTLETLLDSRGQPCSSITIPGHYVPGAESALPSLGTWIAVPLHAEIDLSIVEMDMQRVPGTHRICEPSVSKPPAPHRYAFDALEADTAFAGLPDHLARSPIPPRTEALAQTEPVSVGSPAMIRSQRVVPLRFFPVQYAPEEGELQVVRSLTVRISLRNLAPPSQTEQGWVDEGDYEALLSDLVLNYDSARTWRALPEDIQTPAVTAEAQMQPQAVSGNLRVRVPQDGIYEITYDDLIGAGADPTSIDPQTIGLSCEGQDVAIVVDGEQDGSFDPGDTIVFYGKKSPVRYAGTNVYWLTWGGLRRPRQQIRDVTPYEAARQPQYFTETLRFEESKTYKSLLPSTTDQDHWVGSRVLAYGSAAQTTDLLDVAYPAADFYSITVRGSLYGQTDFDPSPDHHTVVSLNDHVIDDQKWDGLNYHTFTTMLPHTYLLSGPNTVTLRCPLDLGSGVPYDQVYVDWYEILYHREFRTREDWLRFTNVFKEASTYRVRGFTNDDLEVLDITDPDHPIRLTGGAAEPESPTSFALSFTDGERIPETQYLVQTRASRLKPVLEADQPSGLHDSSNAADYLILTHQDFYTSVLPLVDHYQNRGLVARIVDVQDIYDEFSYGITDAEAIKAFLAYAYANWARPAPTYVLLVGDGHYDFDDNYQMGEPIYIPPYLAPADPWMGETAADNRYVCVSGDDLLPDMYLGRLPVKTQTEANAVVAKIIGYETQSPQIASTGGIVLVADDPDDAGNFHALSDDVFTTHTPAYYPSEKIYYRENYSDASEARQTLLDAINDGRLLINYIGHAGPMSWAYPKLLDRADISTLHNGHALPFVVPMTCWEGYYIEPGSPSANNSSVAETFLRKPAGGAIASWSPTGLGLATGHDYLNRALFDALFKEDIIELGPATTYAKLHLYANSGGFYHDLIDTYLLFGDPATRLNVLPVDVQIEKEIVGNKVVYESGDTITYTLAYTNTGPATAHHVVISDTLPATLLEPAVVAAGALITLQAGSAYRWDVADLPAGTGGTITITGIISAPIGPFVNTATLETTSVDGNALNNRATVTTTVVMTDVQIIKTVQPPTRLMPGDRVTYTLSYENTGSALMQGIVITDTLPDVLLDPVVTTAGPTITPRPATSYVWDVEDLIQGARGTITITATVDPDFEGFLVNQTTISTTTQGDYPENNTGKAIVFVGPYRSYLPAVMTASRGRIYLPVVMRTSSSAVLRMGR